MGSKRRKENQHVVTLSEYDGWRLMQGLGNDRSVDIRVLSPPSPVGRSTFDLEWDCRERVIVPTFEAVRFFKSCPKQFAWSFLTLAHLQGPHPTMVHLQEASDDK